MTSGYGINPGASPGGAGVTAGLDRNAVRDWYRRNRARSARFFDMLAERCYLTRPSAWGVHDLVGNGWEWTSTVFAPFDGFQPMPSYPEYSAEFFDGRHHVLKGASPATAHELLRPGFRNWFRPHYPYVYAGFRCARSLP